MTLRVDKKMSRESKRVGRAAVPVKNTRNSEPSSAHRSSRRLQATETGSIYDKNHIYNIPLKNKLKAKLILYTHLFVTNKQ